MMSRTTSMYQGGKCYQFWLSMVKRMLSTIRAEILSSFKRGNKPSLSAPRLRYKWNEIVAGNQDNPYNNCCLRSAGMRRRKRDTAWKSGMGNEKDDCQERRCKIQQGSRVREWVRGWTVTQVLGPIYLFCNFCLFGRSINYGLIRAVVLTSAILM